MIRPYHINVDMELKSCSTIEQTQTHFQARAESFTPEEAEVLVQKVCQQEII